MFFGTHSLTLLDYHQALKLLNHVTCHTLCADWLTVPAIFGDCNPPETFYHIVSPIYHAFTHQMFATDDFIAPCIHFNSCLSHIMFESELYLFHVYVYWCVVDYKMCTCIIRSRVSLVWARAGCKKHTCLSITLVNKEFYLISLSPSPPLFSSLYCYIGTSSIRIKRG